MSENEDNSSNLPEYRWYVDRAKTGRAGCKKCKQKIESGSLRMAKSMPSPFGSGGLMKSWHHLDCMFEVFAKQRATTAKIESVDDVGDWDLLSKEDQEEILKRFPNPDSIRVRKKEPSQVQPSTSSSSSSSSRKSKKEPPKLDTEHRDNSFREFRRLCANIANVSGYLDKTAVVKKFLTTGADEDGFKGDALLVVKLLLPGVIKRVYNLQSKQIVKLFSRIFGTDHDDMIESLEQGDVAETVAEFFEKSHKLKPAKKSLLTLQEVDSFLEYLSKLTREEDQISHFTGVAKKCTANDLKLIIRLVKHDLRLNAGAKHILDAVHDDAYKAFQASRDLNSIIDKLTNSTNPSSKSKKTNGIAIDLNLLTPVLPMLAQACKSVEDAMKRCPNGMYSEIKYDGERVQVHKKGDVFKFYSRSLKPVLPHKVKPLIEFIPKAFPHGKDLILDSEILMIDLQTGDPLPFGSLGKHKKNDYENASVCLFVFDCMFYNGRSLLTVPLSERKEILQENMTEIPFRIVFSEMKEIHDPKNLGDMITQVIRKGLEGLVLKDIKSIYEPGKRHWLKVKKDYLHDGAMADSADLVVLGAWFGTGRKGGLMSVFLMGVYDEDRKTWCTVTKVHGHDDNTLAKLQEDLEMIKIGKDSSLVPSWLNCTKSMVPDFVAADPKKQPVWEITGAEFTKHVVHTASGISVRFPRVKRARDDKTWKTATTLKQLKAIYEKSKETNDFSLGDASPSVSPSKKKRPASTSKADDEPSPKKAKYEIENPFPDLFNGMKIVIPSFLEENKAKKLERYFIAYGGDVLQPEDVDSCTHRLVEKKGSEENEIEIQEIWQCIKNQQKPNI